MELIGLKTFFKSIGEVPKFKFRFLKGTEYITIGDRFSSLDSLRIECWDFSMKISIHQI